ncbi:hypothetical protein [Planctobacterium marinum]|uniref:Uncharacterized protein n=1 Tax=Planctobacterium marinum TaxID=1631968 RepID=A0AA48KQK9_9ALTE|nr:hypothetical protein MACH26_21240 [Planctobacterium marinum]
MNQVGTIQKLLLALSTMLVVVVAYLVSQPNNNFIQNEEQGSDHQLLSELMDMESRLQRQIATLKSIAIADENSRNKSDYFSEIDRVNQQLALLVQRQEDYEKRFSDIETQLLQLVNRDTDVQVTQTRQVNVLSSTEVEFKSAQTKAVPEDHYDDQYAQNQHFAVQQQINAYESQLSEETPDPTWSTTIETKVMRLLNDTPQLSGVHLQESQCGTSLCKLEVYVEEGESVEEKVQTLMVNRPWQGESFVSFEYDGEGAIFFARDGFILP